MRNGYQAIITFIVFTCILWVSVALADNFSTDNFSAGSTGANNIGIDTAKAKKCTKNCFPGDGYPNPDVFGLSGHGPALSYTINGDGTFTDNNTGLIWEIKTTVPGSVHNAQNLYNWTNICNEADPNGTLFTVFLKTLNNSCAGDETKPCTSNLDCAGIGNGKCGFAGHRDWCIPNIKRLQSIVDYSTSSPASNVPGDTGSIEFASNYWSVTTVTFDPITVWTIDFSTGPNNPNLAKCSGAFARAVRPCK